MTAVTVVDTVESLSPDVRYVKSRWRIGVAVAKAEFTVFHLLHEDLEGAVI